MAIKLDKWLIARKKHRLSDKHVQMAHQLGLNPDKLGKIDNHKQEPWKAPLPQFIESIYFKRFKREEPLCLKSIEELMQEEKQKKEKRKKEKEQKRKAEPDEEAFQEAVNDNKDTIPLSMPVKAVTMSKLESGDSPEKILQKESFVFDMAFDSTGKDEVTLSELGFQIKKIHPRYKPRRYGCKTLGAIYEKLGKYELVYNPVTGITDIIRKKN